MAGSFNHLVNEDGRYYLGLIENMGDANEALEECYTIIADLINNYHEGRVSIISEICNERNFPDPWNDDGFPEDAKEPKLIAEQADLDF